MRRVCVLIQFFLLAGCGLLADGGANTSEWFGAPPEGWEITKAGIREFLGDEYREPPNWMPLEGWLAQLPMPRIQDPDVLRYYYKCWYELWLNTELPHAYWTHPIICPSITTYSRGIWLWDSGFHVLGLVAGKERAIELAKDQIRVMLESQHSDGRIPREVWVDGPRFFGMGVQAPGILSLAVLEIYQVTGDWYFVEEVYDRLCKNHEWFQQHTDPDRDGLYTWSGADSGWDASPRWDRGVKGALDLTCWMYLDRRLLSKMGGILGQEGKAAGYHHRAEETARRVQQSMWHPADGLFYDVGADRNLVRIKSPACFFPMFVGIATKEQAARMVEALKDPETFWTPYPVPCAAKDAPGFDPNKYWRGNVWINLNWIVIQGLREYGYNLLADKLSRRTLELIMSHPVSYEYYNPMTGDGLGAKYYGWTAALFIRLCNELIERQSADLLEVTMGQSTSTILPPEDVVLTVELRNKASSPITDIKVGIESEFPVAEAERTYASLEPGAAKAFPFRANVPPKPRGHTYFHFRIEAKHQEQEIVIERGHTLVMRDPYDCILYLPEGRRIGSRPFRVRAAARNFRVQPMGGGKVSLEVPPGWKVSPPSPQDIRFPWSNVRDEKEFTVDPPDDLPGGNYVVGSIIRYPLGRPNKTVRGGTVEVFRPPRWMVIGPFPNLDGKGLKTEYAPEKGIEFPGECTGEKGAVSWMPMPEEMVGENGYVDLLGAFPGQQMAVAYAATAIHSASPVEAVVRVGSDDGIKVWVNGGFVLNHDELRTAAPRQNTAPVELKAGWNPVLLKVSQWERDWGFYFEITDEHGEPIPEVYTSPDGLR